MATQEINDGGPAFPISEHGLQGYNGMSLRDWFAGQALTGLTNANKIGQWTTETGARLAAGTAYRLADAMLKAREAQSHDH